MMTAQCGTAKNARKSSTRDVHRKGGSGGRMAVLRDRYFQEIVPQLREQYQYKSPMQIPRIVKIILNMGLGEAIQNVKILDSATAELSQISGQKPVITKARQSIAAFKLRKGMPIGAWLLLEAAGCTSFTTSSSMLPCPAFVTSEAFLR